MAEYWLVSAPGEPTPEETWTKINDLTANHSSNHTFNIPDLKVGTLDTLVALSDQLMKLDPFVENVVRKIAQYMADILEDPADRANLHENLLVGHAKEPMEAFLVRFRWDQAKFPLRQPLPNIVEGISKLVSQIDSDLKHKSHVYNTLRTNLQAINRKQTGNLMTKSLVEVVRKEHFVPESEYFQTLVVVVPRSLYKDWKSNYETLATYVVPRSSQLISEDSEFGLHTVTVFKKVIDEFKLHAREHKFVVRDFEFNPRAIRAEREEKQRLEVQLKKQFSPLMNWLRVNFSQAFSAWIHLKALRVFTESVLRYSLPVNFQAIVMKPHRKAQKKIHEVLSDLYGALDAKFIASEADTIDLPAGLGFTQQDYHPYVFFKVNLNLFDQ